MSLLGIDVGTTGCKAVIFSEEGSLLASAYEEYDFVSHEPGEAELQSSVVWGKIKESIKSAVARVPGDPVKALAVSSMGESVVPVTLERGILGPSLLGFDRRGEEFTTELKGFLDNARLYRINGNTFGNHYGLTKLLWIKRHRRELYEKTDKFLLWGSFVAYMLGAEPVADYSLANRTLLFDLDLGDWSDELLMEAGIEREKLPDTAPSGTVIGEVSGKMAAELGLAAGTTILTGAHDQCANAVGSGVIREGQAMFGMGTYPCILPVFSQRQEPCKMLERGLNTEHHAIDGKFVSFIYNQGGSIIKWFRDTFAGADRIQAIASGNDIYDKLNNEIPDQPGGVMVLPHFSVMGPPHFISDSYGVMLGLRLDTTRGDIFRGILEGITFALRECVDTLAGAGIEIGGFRAVGGGSNSDAWVQITADIMGRSVVRLKVAEAGALGMAIVAGAGTGVFARPEDGIASMVREDKRFDPNPEMQRRYEPRFAKFARLWPLLREYIQNPAG